ncbi:hypothetical protein HanPSC8_Chr10g0417091 [Helianthus annuus]|nr:hypothetical protein HanPSC8_Chr10g0417091 [Helianthus annuus]
MAMSTYSVLFLVVIVMAVGHSYEDECEALIDTHECNLEVCGKKCSEVYKGEAACVYSDILGHDLCVCDYLC